LTTVPREKIGRRLGRLDAREVVRMNQAILVFLGLARAGSRAPRGCPVGAAGRGGAGFTRNRQRPRHRLGKRTLP
jgi:hypothetical protein